MAVVSFSGRPPADAVAFLQEKVPGGRFSFDWRDAWQDEHTTSFVVAKGMSRDLLTDIHGELIQAIAEGQTRETFIRELRPRLEAAGWWGRRTLTDPATGVAREVQLGSPRRLRIIFDTNMRQAHAAGRWQRFEATKAALPYLVYSAVLDSRTRPQHRAWHRIILPIDHLFWRTHFPPNGWRCRCTVIQAGDALLASRGWTVTTDEALATSGWKKTRPWLNKRTGRTLTVPAGIDPGFGYNVGLSRRAALTPPPGSQPQRSLVIGERLPRRLPDRPRPRPYPPGVAKRPELEGDAVFDAFSKALGVPSGGVFTDKVQIPLPIGPELFLQKEASGAAIASKADKSGRAAYAEILAAALKDPDEIWMSAQSEAGGGVRLVRSYVAAFEDPDGERYWMTVVFRGQDDWWTGTTAFAPGKTGRPGTQADYVDKNARVGTLVYRRPR